MSTPLLIEIGLEEMPALPLLREASRIPSLWEAILNEFGLSTSFSFFYTPRRLLLWHPSFAPKQNDLLQEFFGPPMAVAYKEGEPTQAAKSFATKCQTDLNNLSTTLKDGKEILYFSKTVEGAQSGSLVDTMVHKLLGLLSFGKPMRWGSLSESFIRPVRWYTLMYGDRALEGEIFGVQAAALTFLHRQKSFDPMTLNQASDIFDLLRSGGVILDPLERRRMILEQFERLESTYQMTIERDEALLDEVIAITEYPTAVIGTFDETFLKVPAEAIITSMKTNQRYFPCFDKHGLSSKFIIVSNALTDDFSLIQQGNERVLRARLSDALFFYENDLKHGLLPEKLASVVFMDQMGSLWDKTMREVKIAQTMNALTTQSVDVALVDRAVTLSKADLLSEMVYEFTELQGIMGSYYAKVAGEHDDVVGAIKEQYLPNGEESALPSTICASLVAMSYKIDSILALFSLNKIPTGSKDPFALRRAALGIIKIIHAHRLSLPLNTLLEQVASLYPQSFDPLKVKEFIFERLYQFFDCNASIVKAVIETGEDDLLKLLDKIEALSRIVSHDDFRDNFSTFKRVVNISKDFDFNSAFDVNEALFAQEQERLLWSLFRDAACKNQDDYFAKLTSLFALKPAIESFFDHVMVNVEDEDLRTNRKNLIGVIAKEFKTIADIKEITL